MIKHGEAVYAPDIQRMVERGNSVTSVRPSVTVSVRDGVSNLRLSFSGVSNLRLSFSARVSVTHFYFTFY